MCFNVIKELVRPRSDTLLTISIVVQPLGIEPGTLSAWSQTPYDHDTISTITGSLGITARCLLKWSTLTGHAVFNGDQF